MEGSKKNSALRTEKIVPQRRYPNIIARTSPTAILMSIDKTKLPTLFLFLLMSVCLLTSSAIADWKDIPPDKRLHFKGGAIISGMGYAISRWEGRSRESAFVQSFSIGTLTGIGYELLWDELIRGVGADWEDALYFTFGSATGSAVCASLDYILFKNFKVMLLVPL